MAKDPAMLWYPSDYISGTMGMSFEQKGAYMDLLMLQFNRGHMTEHMIGQAVGQIFGQIQDKFQKDENGLWYNERVDLEKGKRKTYVQSRSNNRTGVNQYTKKEQKKEGHTTSHMGSVNKYSNNSTLTMYNNGLSKFLNYGFEQLKVTDISEKKYFDMVVKEMNSVWMKHKPNYSFLEEADYPALLNIAYLIGKRKKISKFEVVHIQDDVIVKSFDKISEFIANTEDKFFRKLTLDGIAIPKNFQKIEEAMREFSAPSKQNELESKRILPTDYFS
jgi:uncharacterized protein YdaU (DUF1376 family)